MGSSIPHPVAALHLNPLAPDSLQVGAQYSLHFPHPALGEVPPDQLIGAVVMGQILL